jgi:hypothetical protein
MKDDDEAARRARADALRQRIAALKPGLRHSETAAEDSESPGSRRDKKPGDEATPEGESPREFVNRKMRELDRDKADSGEPDS